MTSPTDFNELERAVLNWLRDRYHDESLSAQASAAVFERRDWTGVGCYTYFQVPRWLTPIDIGRLGGKWPINGPGLKSADIDLGGGAIFWGADGFVDCIEMYAFGAYFHEEVQQFELIG